ncbi:MAG: ATP-binding protein [Phycisphaerae bacterium]
MFRGFRHTLFLLLQLGIVLSAAVAWLVQPSAWQAIAICTAGGMVVVWICERLARRWLRATVGRLRRVADDISHGRPAPTLATQPGDDLYKLAGAINLLAARLEEATAEEKRLQEQLRRTERLAFLGELAATVAHEINNPLDGIQSCARILRRSLDDPPRAAQMLDLIDSGLGRIDLIVRRLLTLARQHVIRPVETRVADVLESALTAAANRIEMRGIRVVRQFEAGPDRVLADPQLLEQVFVNLFLNAADSMEADGELSITLRRVSGAVEDLAEGQGPVLVVEVRDTGAGIPADVLPHIFEPFYTTKMGGKGTGLGLPIAARIVDAHRGAIDVESESGRGTVFTVRLPALRRGGRPADESRSAVPQASPPPTESLPSSVRD